jgi:molybdate transport system regulatory protein
MSLQPHFNLWVEKEGQVALSLWRVLLLKAVDEKGSLTAAAKALDVPYRRAWERVRESEQRLGIKLIEGRTGGMGGGGSKLTEAGLDYVARFDRFSRGVREMVEERFEAAFSDLA